MDGGASRFRVLVPGETCWRREPADRFAVIIDAADYFAAVKHVVRKARRRVMFIGWDFDTRIRLDPRGPQDEAPDRLGAFLDWVVKTRPELEIFVLQWDYGILHALGRGSMPFVMLDWLTERRLHIRVDTQHPLDAAHHHKVVTIDDSLAFCGGIDMTADRWDTSDHLDRNKWRRRPTSRRRYGPWHDAAAAVDGRAGAALAELARERWKAATGETLDAVEGEHSLWPDELTPMLKRVEVAISRTIAAYGHQPLVAEIELLYLHVIAATQRTLYIESQYFACRRIAEAIAERLAEPDGPEFVVINPETADGWLEEMAMGGARARLLAMLEAADRYGRFRMFHPVTAARRPIYVHAKVLVMDDRLLRIGSSNLNNRSMGLDSECDLSIEVDGDADDDHSGNDRRRQITALRNRLIAEHLGIATDDLGRAIEAAGGWLIPAIEERCKQEGRSLVRLRSGETGFLTEVLAENELLDPERTPNVRQRVRQRLRRWRRRSRRR